MMVHVKVEASLNWKLALDWPLSYGVLLRCSCSPYWVSL